jgi:hypothetical protein
MCCYQKKEAEKKRDGQLRRLFYEKNRFRRQAETVKDERDCLSKSIEHEEMLDAINQMLKNCDCDKGAWLWLCMNHTTQSKTFCKCRSNVFYHNPR